ncbi:hypothetical protein GZH46_01723, partial [Fragariocoptes setiger]
RFTPSNPAQVQSNAVTDDQLGQQDDQLGPIIKCTSAKSLPAPLLQLTINNRSVPASRIIQNSTITHLDGFETSVAAFQLRLSDFVTSPTQSRSIPERSASKQSSTLLKPATTTTSVAAKLLNSTRMDSSTDKQAITLKLTPHELAHLKAVKSTERSLNEKHRTKRQSIVRSVGPASVVSSRVDTERASHEQHDSTSTNSNSNVVSKQQQQQQRRQQQQQQHRRNTNGLASNSNGNGNGNGNIGSLRYSNYVRIKCSSLVVAVGYEMTSELVMPISSLSSSVIARVSTYQQRQQQQQQSSSGEELSELASKLNESTSESRANIATVTLPVPYSTTKITTTTVDASSMRRDSLQSRMLAPNSAYEYSNKRKD